jgi:hypothetical protein
MEIEKHKHEEVMAKERNNSKQNMIKPTKNIIYFKGVGQHLNLLPLTFCLELEATCMSLPSKCLEVLF